MTILLARIVPQDQIVAVHAPLGEVEWPGTVEHIESNIPPRTYRSSWRPSASGKSHSSTAIEERRKWPSDSTRDGVPPSISRRGPIERELRRYLKAHPHFRGRLINAMGMRADESPARARKIPWRRNDRMSVAGREVFDWLPVYDLSTDDVFRVIHDAGQSPHWIYEHLPRCSCAFCIFSSPEQLRCAAELRPELYRRYAELERRIGHTLSPSRVPLTQLTGIPL